MECKRRDEETWLLIRDLRNALAAANRVIVSGWIDIADELPAVGQHVLFVCDCGQDGWTEPETGRWTGRKTGGKAIVMDYGDDPDWYPCTHWLPIPPLPDQAQVTL